MKSGFTVIELLLAVTFSSMLVTLLMTSFYQINRSSARIDVAIDLDTRAHIINNQMQKDLMGAFVPRQGLKKQEAEKKEQQPVPAKKDAATPEKKERPKPISDVFLSTNKDGMLKELTFITNNPVRIYEYAENAEVKPRVVRVMYRLEQEKNKKGSFILTRQEGVNLDVKHYKKGAEGAPQTFVLAQGIKALALEYKAPRVKEEEKKTTQPDKKQPEKKEKKDEPVVFEAKKEWRSNEIREGKKKQSQLPQWITVTLTLSDEVQEQERSLIFNYQVAAFGQDLIERKAPEEKAPAPQKPPVVPPAGQRVAQVRRRMPTAQEVKTSVQEYLAMMQRKTS
ncbi:MAG: type II secretion system protein J [Candidatus Babeliales bacterium]